MKKIIALMLMLTLIFTFAACSSGESDPTSTAYPTTQVSENEPTVINNTQPTIEVDSDDLDSSWDDSEVSYIKLEGNSITLDGGGATVDGSKITITSAGTYSISGTLDDGQIIVDTDDQEKVKLIFNGVSITCSTSAPVYVVNAEKVVITLATGTENYIADGDVYLLADSTIDEPNAAIFSNDDLTINGEGALTVNAKYNNGIQSQDDLKITGGYITVDAVNDGLKGRDSIVVKDGNIIVNAGADGLQSNNDEDSAKGYISIEGGTFDITSGADGIQAQTSLIINGGNITISSGGGSVNSSTNIGNTGNTWGNWGTGNTNNTASSNSAKGLKAGVDVTITGGTINIDSSDDSVHSNGTMSISGADIVLASGDDGIHSDSALEISGGNISIDKSYEGMESAIIKINEGNIHIVSRDDGINVVGGVDGSAINGRPGQNTFNVSGDNYLNINGGYIFIDAGGDGIDINGPITMTSGKVIINGPSSNANGALDYLGYFTVTGGYLIAAGSSGMAQAPSTSSTQYSVMINLSSSQSANTIVHIETEDGKEILTFVPTKVYQSVVLCSSELKSGSTYVVYTGGKSTGTVTDGLYSGGTYTAGTQVTNFTITGIVTNVGNVGSMGGGFPGSGGGGRR